MSLNINNNLKLNLFTVFVVVVVLITRDYYAKLLMAKEFQPNGTFFYSDRTVTPPKHF